MFSVREYLVISNCLNSKKKFSWWWHYSGPLLLSPAIAHPQSSNHLGIKIVTCTISRNVPNVILKNNIGKSIFQKCPCYLFVKDIWKGWFVIKSSFHRKCVHFHPALWLAEIANINTLNYLWFDLYFSWKFRVLFLIIQDNDHAIF